MQTPRPVSGHYPCGYEVHHWCCYHFFSLLHLPLAVLKGWSSWFLPAPCVRRRPHCGVGTVVRYTLYGPTRACPTVARLPVAHEGVDTGTSRAGRELSPDKASAAPLIRAARAPALRNEVHGYVRGELRGGPRRCTQVFPFPFPFPSFSPFSPFFAFCPFSIFLIF